MHADELAQLVGQQVGLLFVGQHLDGDARHLRIVGGAHGQRFDVVALAGEQPHDPRKHARLVVHQHGQGLTGNLIHCAYLLNRS